MIQLTNGGKVTVNIILIFLSVVLGSLFFFIPFVKRRKEMSLKEFQDMCNKIILESKYMPRVADFGKDYNTFLLEVMHKNRKYSEEYLESLYDNI